MRKSKRLSAMFVIFLLLFSSIPLSLSAEEVRQEKQVDLGPWAFSAFGPGTVPATNPEPIVQDPNTVIMSTYGGKIASGGGGTFLLLQRTSR